jgi:hypothetical protein
MGEAGRKRAVNEFDWRIAAGKFDGFLKELDF